jgi:capsular polysaccharide biosynthesis protein
VTQIMDELKQQQENPVEEGITLSELLKIVWNNITIVFLVTFWVTIIGVVYTFYLVDPEFTAETSIMVQVDLSNPDITQSTEIDIANKLMATYKEFVVSDKVLTTVKNDITGLPSDYSLVDLKDSITVSSSTSVLIIYIEVVNENPALAEEIANQLVKNSILIANDDENGYVLLRDKLVLLDEATEPTAPSAPNKLLNVVISFLIGAILSLGIVFIKELFNNKFQSTGEMERYLNINVIAAVPGVIKERKLVD